MSFLVDAVDDEAISVEDTTQLLDSYVDGVDTELDKDRLKGKMRDLLTEAQASEIAMIIFRTLKYKNFLSTGNKWVDIDYTKSKSTLVIGHNGRW